MLNRENELKRKIFVWLKSLKYSTNSSTTSLSKNYFASSSSSPSSSPFGSTIEFSTRNYTKITMMSVDVVGSASASAVLDSNQTSTNKYLDQQNISQNDLNDFNITIEHLDDFLQKLFNLGTSYNVNDTNKHAEESDYCKGDVRNFLVEYNNNYHGYISLLICVFGTIANILNIIVLTRKDMSKTPINKILKWLAVADMFVMIEYIPFASYMYIISPVNNGKYTWAMYLLFHMHFSQILHTISISLTVTLAVWRYIAIRYPHGTFATFLLSHCSEAILFSFIISPILCFPTFFVFNIKEENQAYRVDAQENTDLYSVNFWAHSILIKLLPCCILTVISFILVRVLCDASKRRIKLKEYSQPAHSNLNGNHRSSKCDRRPDRTTMLLVAVLFLFLITEFPQGILGLLSGVIGKSFFVGCYLSFGEVMDLLALFNAAVGFVLYGLMSKQFRTSFKSLFFETRLSRTEMTRITGIGITTTCV